MGDFPHVTTTPPMYYFLIAIPASEALAIYDSSFSCPTFTLKCLRFTSVDKDICLYSFDWSGLR